MVLAYSSPLLRTRLLCAQKRVCPSSVSMLSPKFFFNNASLFRNGVSLQVWSYFLQAAKTASASWASPQSTMCMGANFAALTCSSFSRCTCSHRSSLLASATPLSVAPQWHLPAGIKLSGSHDGWGPSSKHQPPCCQLPSGTPK